MFDSYTSGLCSRICSGSGIELPYNICVVCENNYDPLLADLRLGHAMRSPCYYTTIRCNLSTPSPSDSMITQGCSILRCVAPLFWRIEQLWMITHNVRLAQSDVALCPAPCPVSGVQRPVQAIQSGKFYNKCG